MIGNLVFVIVGLVGLYFGADFLVKGASRLASSFGIPALVIGLTVVSYGTSMPEQLVSVVSALQDKSDIAIGNVVGSNIFNIVLILGVTAFIAPIGVHSQLVRREVPLMIGISILTYVLALDKNISRLEGVLLFAGVIAFTVFSYLFSEKEDPKVTQEIQAYTEAQTSTEVNRPLEGGRTLLGVFILVVAARLTIDGAIGIAKEFGISDVVIGLTLVSAGTSLPELATSIIAAMKKEADIAIGNVVGSNIFNLLSILGLTAIISPMNVASEYLRYDFPIMILVAALLLPIVWDRKITRLEGSFFIGLYICYTVFLFLR